MSNRIVVNYVSMKVEESLVYTFVIKVKYLINLSYVAVRGKDKEEGAVQRVLNKKRIGDIKEYVLKGHMFVNTFIINWVDSNCVPKIMDNGTIEIPNVFAAAQLIDGQHRLEGIKEAAKMDATVLDKQVLVTMAINMGTKEAAQIFININSEQKPVPRSLIYDLYGVTEDDRNFAIVRADDIAKMLNENIESPYYNLIKYPGSPRGKGKIDLSTVVSTLRKYVDVKGKFFENNIRDLNRQGTSIINYFNALKYHWELEQQWDIVTQNVFYKASGFVAAVDFFFEYVFIKCVEKKSFKYDYIKSLFDFSNCGIIRNEDIRGTDGKTARKMIEDTLRNGLITVAPSEEEYEF